MIKSREAFEKHMIERGFTSEALCQNLLEDYSHPRVQLAWEAWQAALECTLAHLDPLEMYSVWIDGHTENSLLLRAKDAKEAALRFCENEMEGVDLEDDNQRFMASLCHGSPFKVAVLLPDESIEHFACANLLTIKTEVKKWEDEGDDNN